MVSVSIFSIAFVSILVLVQPLAVLSDLFSSLAPLISPVFDDVCKEVGCGKGTCKPSPSSTFFFECECEDGWKQASSHFKFLPCIVPDCSINYTCDGTAPPPPVQQKATKLNDSFFDPCQWTDCGGGSCNTTSAFEYDCLCEAGYDNLMNLTSLPCYKECAFGVGCSDLGISFSNSSATFSPPAPDDNGGKNADDVCKEVGCGKGTCKPSPSSTFFFECECEDGWKQASSHFKFLPCIVPDCSINYTCDGTAPPPPVQQKATKLNDSFFDPCHWTYCGGGSCNTTSAFEYNCLCEAGYNNLLNLTSLPCYKECAFGVGCSDFGISFSNSSMTLSPPAPDDNGGKNAGVRNLQLNHFWLILLMISLSVLMIQ